MRLVSKIHDYYDGVFRTSVQDKSSTFVRNKKEEIKPVGWKGHIPAAIERYNDGFEIFFGVVGFCGAIYPFVKVQEGHGYGEEHIRIDSFHYNFEDFVRNHPKIVERFDKNPYKYFFEEKGLDEIKNWLKNGKTVTPSLSKPYREDYVITKDRYFLDMFIKERICYFSMIWKSANFFKDITMTFYPVLKDVQFFKVFDSYAAFQQIEMFLSNQIVKPDDPFIAPVPDKIKVESHGFDKHSFRKDKSTKKVRIGV